jgi:hypothetical protein
MGLGPIPSSHIRGRCIELCLSETEADRFFSIIRQMDNYYLDVSNSLAKPERQVQEVTMDDASGVIRLFNKLEASNNGPRRKNVKK